RPRTNAPVLKWNGQHPRRDPVPADAGCGGVLKAVPRQKKRGQSCPRFLLTAYALGQDPRNHFALDQLPRLIEVVVDQSARVNADAVVDRGQQLGRMDRVFQRGAGGLVRLAVDEAALDAGTGHHTGIAIRPVVAAVVAVLVPAGADAALRAAAELADGN